MLFQYHTHLKITLYIEVKQLFLQIIICLQAIRLWQFWTAFQLIKWSSPSINIYHTAGYAGYKYGSILWEKNTIAFYYLTILKFCKWYLVTYYIAIMHTIDVRHHWHNMDHVNGKAIFFWQSLYFTSMAVKQQADFGVFSKWARTNHMGGPKKLNTTYFKIFS